MNTLTKSFAKRVISMLLVTIMVFSLGIVGLTSASAADVEMVETGGQYNMNWQGKVYFLAPESWNLTTYNTIQVDITRTTNKSESNHQEYIGTMTRVGSSRLFYLQINSDHSGWNQNEYIAFTANSYAYGSGSFVLSNNHYRTVPLDYGCNNSSNYYLFKPASESANNASNDNTMTASYSSSQDLIKAKQTVNLTVNGSSSSAGGTVKMTGYYFNNSDTAITSSTATSSSSTVSYEGAVQGSSMKLEATTKTGYTFAGWYSGSTLLSSNTSYTYNVFNAKTITAKFEKAVSIDSPTATIGSEGGTSASAVVGNPVDITVDYSVTGSTNTPTLTLCDASGNTIGNAYNVEINDKVITVTPPNAGDYTFKVKVEVDGVSEFTNEVTLEYKNEYSASLSVDVEGATAYTDDPFVFTLTDNADLYDSATYEVYCNDELVDVQWDGKSFTVSHSEAGDYTYIVKATVTDGTETKEVYTNDVKIAVKAKIFNITLSSDATTILENRDFTITAASEFAQGAVTYKLEATDGTLIEGNTNGIFNVTAKDVAENAGSEVITYTVTANDGNTEVTATIQITVNEDKGEFPVKIFFKCSDTYGYLPNAKINGAEVDLTVSDKIICYNATESATYSWYSYTSATDTPYGTDFVFEVNANRNYFYNASYTVTAGEGKYDFDGTYYCYYLALENLNGGSNTLTNISAMTENDRNWTYSAVNMIYDDADASVPVGLNYSYAAIADANTDGSVNIKDATYIQKNLAKAVEASELSELVSDVNGDGKVTIKDATAIQKQLAGL